jgi:cytochrome bd ubiquinol oxidase subunit II
MIPFWFILITILWMGFFVLEGFDFGVGILHGVVGRDEPASRAAINTICPPWDGNEVWLVVAGAAIFAAFPAWYATMFSGYYLAVVILLVALIVRGVSFEYRGKRDSARWRATWTGLLVAGSIVAPFILGIALGDLLHGVPINASQQFTGTLASLFQPYGIYTGITLVLICVLHGATFLGLKTDGEVRERAVRLARLISPVVFFVVLAFAFWTHATATSSVLLNPVEFAAVLAALAAVWFSFDRRAGWAFTATTVTMATSVLAIFVDLYPNVMVSSTSPAFNLTVHNTASPPYTLGVMTIIALIALPFVLAYQSWTYYVFRRRITADSFRPGAQPAVAQAAGHGGAFAATSSVAAMSGAEQGQSGAPASSAPAGGTSGTSGTTGAARGRPGRGTRRRPPRWRRWRRG